MKSDIILSAKGAGVCERPGGDKLAQVGAGFHLIGQRGNELIGRRLLHEAHERFKRAKVECVGRVGSEGRGEAEFSGYAIADRGNEHSAADITSGTLSDARLSANVVLSGTNVSRLNNDVGYLTASALASAATPLAT